MALVVQLASGGGVFLAFVGDLVEDLELPPRSLMPTNLTRIDSFLLLIIPDIQG